jgi:hypothetical protein
VIHAAKSVSKGQVEWVKKHLPEVLYCHEYPTAESESHVRLITYLNDPKYDKQELRVIIQRELFPITSLTKVEQVKKVFKDILECGCHSVE